MSAALVVQRDDVLGRVNAGGALLLVQRAPARLVDLEQRARRRLTEALNDLKGSTPKDPITIVLLTDGAEDTRLDRDPVAAASALGKKEGIIANLPILDEYGLLGKTIQIGDGAALVQLITDKNYRVSIRVGVDRTLGIFVPTHGKYGILEGIRKSMPLKNGEIAFTSGISEIYPPNIPVAKVISTNIDK